MPDDESWWLLDNHAVFVTLARGRGSSGESDDPVAAIQAAVATNLAALPEDTRELVWKAFRDCRGALDAFDFYRNKFWAGLPGFVQRVGEADADFAARRAADSKFLCDANPGLEGRRQEAVVAGALLPSCAMGMVKIIGDGMAPEQVGDYAAALSWAATATHSVILNGLDSPKLMKLRQDQCDAYQKMAEFALARGAVSVSGNIDPADLRFRQLRLVARAEINETFPHSVELMWHKVANSPLEAQVNGQYSHARMTEVVRARHEATTKTIFIQLLYGKLPLLTKQTIDRENKIITDDVPDFRERHAVSHPDASWEEYVVHIDQARPTLRHIRNTVRNRKVEELNNVVGWRMEPEQAAQLRETFRHATSDMKIVFSGHGSTWSIGGLTARQLVEFTNEYELAEDAHVRMHFEACWTGGIGPDVRRRPDDPPLAVAVQKLHQAHGRQVITSGYTRTVIGGAGTFQAVEETTALGPLRELAGIGRDEKFERKAPGSKKVTYTDTVTAKHVTSTTEWARNLARNEQHNPGGHFTL